MSVVYFKATKGGKLAGVAQANNEKMAKEVVAQLEAAGCTVSVITELDFHILVNGAMEDGAKLTAHVKVERVPHAPVAPGVH